MRILLTFFFFLPVLPGIISGDVADEKERAPQLPPFLGVCAVVVVDEFFDNFVDGGFFVEFFRIFFREVFPDAFEAGFGSFGDGYFAESFGECHLSVVFGYAGIPDCISFEFGVLVSFGVVDEDVVRIEGFVDFFEAVYLVG